MSSAKGLPTRWQNCVTMFLQPNLLISWFVMFLWWHFIKQTKNTWNKNTYNYCYHKGETRFRNHMRCKHYTRNCLPIFTEQLNWLHQDKVAILKKLTMYFIGIQNKSPSEWFKLSRTRTSLIPNKRTTVKGAIYHVWLNSINKII